MNQSKRLFAMAMMMVSFSPAWAQSDDAGPATEPMDHSAMPGMDHGAMPGMDQGTMPGMDHGAMPGMNHGAMPDATPSSGLRDPHATADGYDFSQFPMRHEDMALKLGAVRVDRLETVRADSNTSAAYALQAWYGGDFDRAVFKAEGDIDDGEVQEGRTEVLWGHAISPFWDAQLGLRYDHGIEPDRGWLAFGVQGLAPYWFEVNASVYVGEQGHTALGLEADYELLLTQKLILQPRIEATLYGKRDVERGLGAGLSDMVFGLRLRYEIRREIAPYVGVEWAKQFNGTADDARTLGQETDQTRVVAGVRFWF